MTKQEAKALSLEVRRYLAEHPALSLINNTYVPRRINRIREPYGWFPLCLAVTCEECPLWLGVHPNNCVDGPFGRYAYSPDLRVKKEAAGEIVRRIEAWEVEG
jgi:hypothetical protein